MSIFKRPLWTFTCKCCGETVGYLLEPRGISIKVCEKCYKALKEMIYSAIREFRKKEEK